MLLDRTGMPLIRHTWLAARQSLLAHDLMVATDDREIFGVVESFGGKAIMTDPGHATGTDRLAEVARQCPEYGILVNVQGDEPEMDPRDIDLAISTLLNDATADMATLACPIHDRSMIEDPACVKVVFDHRQRALYFSRSAIPFPRSGFETAIDDFPRAWFQHLGIYVYRRQTLLEISHAVRPPAEQAESLEQLRALHAGKTILVGLAATATKGIDTAGDYEAFVRRNAS
jgi:3-deoxy-manno-octulosonate cytidylyltransferase (CMP-KDO synthetase)